MDKRIIEEVKKIVDSTKNEDGWTSMANVGTLLNANGIKIWELGYPKVKMFFEAMPDYFELGTDSNNLPVIKVRNEIANNVKSRIRDFKNEQKTEEIHLTNWASINQRNAVDALCSMALPERWTYNNADEDYPNPILAKYLKWTFVKVMRENKISYCRNKYAAFNTGLVNKFYEPIYAVFDKNLNNKQPWHFVDFCVAGSRNKASLILASYFSEMPERATYIKDYDDVIYDTNKPVDVNWEHIILENIERMPVDLLKQVCFGLFEVKDTEALDILERQKYYADLKTALSGSPTHLSQICGIMKTAVETAKLRVAWNYKTAIPVYYPTDDKVHLILPLALNMKEPEKISLALVMTKMPSGRYRAATIFTLDMAYSNARLITKPSSDWLMAETINEVR